MAVCDGKTAEKMKRVNRKSGKCPLEFGASSATEEKGSVCGFATIWDRSKKFNKKSVQSK